MAKAEATVEELVSIRLTNLFLSKKLCLKAAEEPF
jgi:hypothetical protein